MIRFQNLSYTYPFQSQKALDDVSFTIKTGETVLCTGKSGCGKSVLLRLINGLAPHYYRGQVEGRVTVNGQDNSEREIHGISEDVGTLFQDPEHQFFAVNVEDELAFAHECHSVEPHEIRRRITSVVDRFGLKPLIASSIFDLSEGEKQKVALASIISLSPKIIVLDEPTANLDPEATRELAGILKELKSQGMTIFIVDHRLYWLKDLVDRVIVLQDGKIRTIGDFACLEDDELRETCGLRHTSVEDPRNSLPSVNETNGDGIEIENLGFAYKQKAPLFESACARLPFGKVVAITGANGAGKTTFARLLTGLLKMQSGTIAINGNVVKPQELLKRSSVILQNTDHQLHMQTVRAELELSASQFSKSECQQKTHEALDMFHLKDLADRHPQSLSGGQKQRLVIACGLMKDPDILILDEPTSGLDGENMRIIAGMMRRLADKGACVLVISHDLELLHMVCNCQLTLPLS